MNSISWMFIIEFVIVVLIIKNVFELSVQQKQLRTELDNMIAENQLSNMSISLTPHFIQNIFELAIRNIKNKKAESAAGVLTDISSFLKKALMQSGNNIVSLKEELEFIKAYMDMQLKINPDLFEYAFYMAPNINLSKITVPKMLLQPAVENCIKHGFNGIQHQGKIEITITVKNEMINISIKDNGTGLKNKWALDKVGNITRKSKGIDITKKRLLLAVKEHNRCKADLFITNRNDLVQGTAFQIQFPQENY